jgi:PTH1 family peptidyl-tRNA hydrolase
MPIIAGLGNIGEEYHGTRHNIGFEIADRLADKLSMKFKPAGGPFLSAEGSFRGRPVIIIKPGTYMNLSGKAISKACVKYRMPLTECLVCYDDLNLPTGKIRFREKGSAGGHNGIESIIEHSGSRIFPRLRFGIGSDFQRGRQADYVLSSFEKQELADVEAGLEKSIEGVLCFIREGITHAMNRFN